ncbi:MAG: BrnT family toxin [Thiothrix sp.]|nr:MAG: BrnT family toxin [Thiothrix sp.]
MEELYFEWDEDKRKSNIIKHGVDFADVVSIFYEESTLTIADPRHYDEERYIALGLDAKTRLVVVVHVYRDEDVIRIISARLADFKEKQQFEQVNYGR